MTPSISFIHSFSSRVQFHAATTMSAKQDALVTAINREHMRYHPDGFMPMGWIYACMHVYLVSCIYFGGSNSPLPLQSRRLDLGHLSDGYLSKVLQMC